LRQLLTFLCIGLLLVIVGCSTHSKDSNSSPNENGVVQSTQAGGTSIDSEGLTQGTGELATEAEAVLISDGAEHSSSEVGAPSPEVGSVSQEAGAASPQAGSLSVDGEDQAQAEQTPTSEADATSLEKEVEPIAKKRQLPDGFVYVDEVLEHALYEIRYYSDNNFIGERIDGYNAPYAILSEKAAKALLQAEQELAKQGYAFLIYDAYRPHKAVEQFIEWAADEQDTRMQEQFYPDIDKKNVFQLGYLSRRSGHSRGSTIDLTLVHIESGDPLNMGSPYDLLGEISAHDANGLTNEQQERRTLLKETMLDAGFEPYSKEWWHYTLRSEPYPKQYFDFDVE